VPWRWHEGMVLASARVNGLVSNLPGLARVEVGTRSGEVDVCVRVARPGTIADALAVVTGASGLLVVAPDEQVIQARSAFGREMAADAEGIREQLARD
jgi:hypothetical protein